MKRYTSPRLSQIALDTEALMQLAMSPNFKVDGTSTFVQDNEKFINPIWGDDFETEDSEDYSYGDFSGF